MGPSPRYSAMMRVRAREDLDGVAHLLGDLQQREALLGEAQAGVRVTQEVGVASDLPMAVAAAAKMRAGRLARSDLTALRCQFF